MSNWLELELLDAVFNADVGTLPIENVYVKLHIGDPGEDGTGNAAAETDRVEMTAGAAAAGATTNDNAITWTNVSNAETYSHISLWDNSTAGNCLMYGALSASKAVNAGDTFTIAAGDLDVTFS
jgi:hypothetical protein